MGWLEGWSNNIMRFTIDSSKVDSNLTNFPLLITLSSGTGVAGDYDATSIFDELGDAGKKKIAVTTANGETQCPIEIEYWDATEEVAHLWTKVPIAYSSVDTTMYLYYDSNQPDNVDYVSESSDPKSQLVINIGSEGTYDTVHAIDASVIKDGSIYKMWYSGYNGNYRIIYCESENGTTWSGHQVVIDIGDEGTYDTNNAYGANVIKDGSLYKMWYSGHNGSNYRIIYCESANGTTWSGHQMVVDIGDEGTYDTTHSYTPTVIKDGSIYRMWYSGYDGANIRILYCDSPNGTSWSNHQLVVDIGAEGTYDAVYSHAPTVIKDGSTYKMWYGGHDGSVGWRTLYCDSLNGTSWSNHQLVVNVGIEGTNDTNGAASPCVMKEDIIHRMWYSGYDGSNYRILYIKSYDGIIWQTSSQAVWDDNYIAVYHMNQDPSGGSGAIKDSTVSGSHCTSAGSMSSNNLVTSVIGKGIDFDGTDDYIYSGNTDLDLSNEITLEIIVDQDRAQNYILGNSNYNSNYGLYCLTTAGTGALRFSFYGTGGTNTYSSTNTSDYLGTGLYHLATKHEFGNGTNTKLLINGATVSGGWTAGTGNDANVNINPRFEIAHWYGTPTAGSPSYLYDGTIDEVRVSKVARSVAWLKASYSSNANQLLSFDPLSYLEGQCTDRYGVPMEVECDVVALDAINHSILGYGTSVSGTGRFAIRVYGKEPGQRVLVTFSYPGVYGSDSYPAGAEYMTTISGTTISGGGY